MKYLIAQIKRVVRYLPFALLISVLLTVVLGLFAVRFVGASVDADDKQMVRIGIVGDTSTTFLGFGIELIREADSSNMMLRLEEMSESEAISLLDSGKITAYIKVPDGFIEGVSHGDVMQLEYVTTDVSGGITSVFKEEILSAVSNMLVHSQKGIYAMQQLARANSVAYGKNTDELVLRYFNLILKRPSVLSLDVRGVSDGVDFLTYLMCGLFVLCVSLFGIPYCNLYVSGDKSIRRLAASRGVSVYKQTVAEFASYLCAMIFTLFAIMLIIGTIGICDLRYAMALFASCIPALFVVAALQFFGFSVSDNLANAVIIQFFGAIVLSYVCGCIYPIAFFPKAVQTVGGVLPLSIARESVISAVCGDLGALEISAPIVCSAILVSAAVAVNYRKTLSDK